MKPAFCVSDDELATAVRSGMYDFGPAFWSARDRDLRAINQVRSSENTLLQSVPLEGAAGPGKTALAAHLARESGFPSVKVMSPANTRRRHSTSRLVHRPYPYAQV